MNSIKTIQCPLCNDTVDKLLYRYHIGSEQKVIERIKNHNPQWTEDDGACSRCVDYYHTEIVMEQRILPEIGPHFPIKSVDDFVILPTGIRLDADPRYTGKGITICFIDSGFYLHADLVNQGNRIKKIIDIHDPAIGEDYFSQPHPESWHGCMTTVVCAGDGWLGNGLYKGIASDAELVMIKVQDRFGRITTQSLVDALQWVLTNHKVYNIRIVNMSVSSDETGSYHESEVDKLAEQLYDAGISVVAAVGNDEAGIIKAPANALHVIAVGGINDENKLGDMLLPYHSSFGKTVDELMKPELVAHAMWIAAPILPGTEDQQEAVTLYELLNKADEANNEDYLNDSDDNERINTTALLSMTDTRESIIKIIQTRKYISPHYMHVDGTSFAAPIVSSVIAQLLEVNPNLSPAQVREVLFGTAKRLAGLSPERQGFGVIRPRNAVLRILKKNDIGHHYASPIVNKERKTIEFYLHHDCAEQVSVSGSFNLWAEDVLIMEACKNGLWKIEIPMLPEGRYLYKFFVDEKIWIEDVNNPFREPDGFNGFNSILLISAN